jgi:SAM-dependent methyltransferase
MGARPESPGREYARRFALEHAHYRDDLAFWAALADELGGPVLDVGAATGRVAIELARRGHEVWAVDPSPDMRAELLAALAGEDAAVAGRVRVRDGRLEGLSLGRRFPLVVVAMNTMQVLLGEEDRRAAFASLAEHLAPGGRIAFDVARVSPAEAAASIGFEVPIGEHRPAGGGTIVQTSWYEDVDARTSTARFAIRIVDERPGAPPELRERRHEVHLYAPEEIDRLAAGAGLTAVATHGDFSGGPLRVDSEVQIHVLAHAGEAAA